MDRERDRQCPSLYLSKKYCPHGNIPLTPAWNVFCIVFSCCRSVYLSASIKFKLQWCSDLARQLWDTGDATVVSQLHHHPRHSDRRKVPVPCWQVRNHFLVSFTQHLLWPGGWQSTGTTWPLRCKSRCQSRMERPMLDSSSSKASLTSWRMTISSGVSSLDLWGVGSFNFLLFCHIHSFTHIYPVMPYLWKILDRFTRTQRVCVSMATLYLAMLTNAMWYYHL